VGEDLHLDGRRPQANDDRGRDTVSYDIATTGLGYDFIQQLKHVPAGRAGLSYRYDQYENPATPVVNSLGADFEPNHSWFVQFFSPSAFQPFRHGLVNHAVAEVSNPAGKFAVACRRIGRRSCGHSSHA
jgi:hypothetical protein